MAHRQRLILNAKESGKLKMISTSLDTLPTEILNESYYSSGSTVDFNQAYTQVSELTQITFIDNNLTNIPSELISVHPNITHIDVKSFLVSFIY